MKQRTLAAQSGFERYTKKTRRALFLEEMEQVVPWAELCALIEPVYPKAGPGRPPVGVERMLRIYFLQQWFNLSDPPVEEALYESVSLRGFVDIDLGREPVPDETTVCKFRHSVEKHELGAQVEAEDPPGVVWDVFVGLPANAAPDTESPFFVGTLSLFGPGIRSAHHHSEPAHFVYPINRAIAAAMKANPERTTVTFVPHGVLVSGKPSRPEVKSRVRIGQAKLTVETKEENRQR